MQMLLETISSSCLLMRLKKANAFDLIAARRESSRTHFLAEKHRNSGIGTDNQFKN
jgi:hypothetical protein